MNLFHYQIITKEIIEKKIGTNIFFKNIEYNNINNKEEFFKYLQEVYIYKLKEIINEINKNININFLIKEENLNFLKEILLFLMNFNKNLSNEKILNNFKNQLNENENLILKKILKKDLISLDDINLDNISKKNLINLIEYKKNLSKNDNENIFLELEILYKKILERENIEIYKNELNELIFNTMKENYPLYFNKNLSNIKIDYKNPNKYLINIIKNNFFEEKEIKEILIDTNKEKILFFLKYMNYNTFIHNIDFFINLDKVNLTDKYISIFVYFNDNLKEEIDNYLSEDKNFKKYINTNNYSNLIIYSKIDLFYYPKITNKIIEEAQLNNIKIDNEINNIIFNNIHNI